MLSAIELPHSNKERTFTAGVAPHVVPTAGFDVGIVERVKAGRTRAKAEGTVLALHGNGAGLRKIARTLGIGARPRSEDRERLRLT